MEQTVVLSVFVERVDFLLQRCREIDETGFGGCGVVVNRRVTFLLFQILSNGEVCESEYVQFRVVVDKVASKLEYCVPTHSLFPCAQVDRLAEVFRLQRPLTAQKPAEDVLCDDKFLRDISTDFLSVEVFVDAVESWR